MPFPADADEEEEGESEQEEEDIFELEGQTEHLHIGTPRESAQAPERLRGRGGWEGAAGGGPAPKTALILQTICSVAITQRSICHR